jgi:two-component system response regulator YesN
MDELVKVLIIDDEDFVIEGLQRHIAWENLGMQVVGTASDGKDGVVQTLRLKPDCIITDISMPNMDGISMIEHLYKMGLRPYTLIYTGYNDFEYAQRALIYGVSDYILKPALPEEFEQSLGIICKKIRGEWKNIEELQRLRQNFEESKQLLFKPFLEELFTGRIITHEQFARKDMFFGSNLVDREYVVIAIHLDCNQEQFSNLDIEQQFYVMYRIIHFVQSLFPGLTYSTGFQANTAFFLCANDIQSIQLQEMVGLCTRILNYCNSIDDLNLLVRIGISDIVVTYEEIHVAYLQAKQCIRESEDNEVLQYAHCCDDADSPIISWGFDKDQLIDAMLLGNVELATQLTDKFFLYLSKLPPPRDVYLTPMIAELVSSIMVFLVQHGIESDLDAFELVSQRFSTIQEAHKRVTEFVNSSIAAIQKRELGKNYQIINRIVSYTKEHLEEGITLSRIADIMQFTPNYLSTLFTKSMGISYSQYLAKIRIQRAKELLDSGKYKVYEVGYMIGFKNPEYFTKVFKEYVGTTPSSYIKPQ